MNKERHTCPGEEVQDAVRGAGEVGHQVAQETQRLLAQVVAVVVDVLERAQDSAGQETVEAGLFGVEVVVGLLPMTLVAVVPDDDVLLLVRQVYSGLVAGVCLHPYAGLQPSIGQL